MVSVLPLEAWCLVNELPLEDADGIRALSVHDELRAFITVRAKEHLKDATEEHLRYARILHFLHNTLALVNYRLPAEILSMIIAYSWTKGREATLVCRRWRSVSLTTSLFWTQALQEAHSTYGDLQVKNLKILIDRSCRRGLEASVTDLSPQIHPHIMASGARFTAFSFRINNSEELSTFHDLVAARSLPNLIGLSVLMGNSQSSTDIWLPTYEATHLLSPFDVYPMPRLHKLVAPLWYFPLLVTGTLRILELLGPFLVMYTMDHIRIALRNCPHIVDLSLICLPEHGLLADLPPDETITQRSRRPIHFTLLSTLRLQFLGEVSIQATMSILSFPTSAFVDVLDYFHPTVLHLLDGNPAWAKHAFSRITSLVAEDVGGDRGLTSLLASAHDEPVFRLISRLALDRPTFLIAFQQAPITSLRLSSMFQAPVGEQRWHFATILRAFPQLRALELYGPIADVFTLFTDHSKGLMDESCRTPGEEPRIVCPRLAHLKLTILVDQACRLRVPLVDGHLDAAAAHVRDGYFKPLAYILACRTRLGAARLKSLQVTLEWAAERASDGVVELDGGACEVPADLRGCVDGPVVVEATGRLRFK